MLTPQQMSSFNAVLVERLVSLKLYLNSFYIYLLVDLHTFLKQCFLILQLYKCQLQAQIHKWGMSTSSREDIIL